MSMIEAKVGEGLNKLQGTIQQGKMKMQSVQEIGQMTEQMTQLKQKRMEAIIDMGNEIHRRIRSGIMADDPVMLPIAARVEELDKSIYVLAQTLHEQKQSASSDHRCANKDCTGIIQEGDKFCGTCGTPVPEKASVATELKDCLHCQTQIPASAAFCPCCGAGV